MAPRRVQEGREGFKIRGTEIITMDTPAGRTPIDALAETPGGGASPTGATNLVFFEAKNGPTATVNSRQAAAFPHIENQGGIPAGENARRAGLTPGEQTAPIPIIIRTFSPPVGIPTGQSGALESQILYFFHLRVTNR